MMVAPTSSSHLDSVFGALSDPTRRAILLRLMKGDASVLELAEPFELSQPAVTKHIQVLERAGLVSRTRDAQRRPCRIEAQPLVQATRWLTSFQELWDDRYNALDNVLEQVKSNRQKKGKV